MADNSFTPGGPRASEHTDGLTQPTDQRTQSLNEAANKVDIVRNRLDSTIASFRETCARLQDLAADRARATDRMLRDYPYPSLGVAFAAGLMIGILVNRKS